MTKRFSASNCEMPMLVNFQRWPHGSTAVVLSPGLSVTTISFLNARPAKAANIMSMPKCTTYPPYRRRLRATRRTNAAATFSPCIRMRAETPFWNSWRMVPSTNAASA